MSDLNFSNEHEESNEVYSQRIMVNLEGKVIPEFWRNKRVFMTGHTGFKGSWLSLWLQDMGAIVKGYALKAHTTPNLFEEARVAQDMESEIGDIRDIQAINSSITNFEPDLLIHMAAQPLVRLSYKKPVETYETNVMGTINVLEAARQCNELKAVVVITTDKCYENKERFEGYREHEAMGGHDPYSSSKGCCELLISSYRRSFFNQSDSALIASARAGNVIGGGDWSEDRLIPDILRALDNSESIVVRNPLSIRPWQHVLEPLSGYLVLAQQLYNQGSQFAQAWNFGPNDQDCKSVEWIVRKMIKKWGSDVSWQRDSNHNLHEAQCLKLDCTKAKKELKWKPKMDLDFALELIISWQKKWLSNENIKEECISQIREYNSK